MHYNWNYRQCMHLGWLALMQVHSGMFSPLGQFYLGCSTWWSEIICEEENCVFVCGLFVGLFLLLVWPLFVTYCVHLHAYVLPSSEVRLSKQSVSPSTVGVTHGLLSLQRVTCFSISSALKNTLMSCCSCALSVHSSSWVGSVVCQHHANVASVKAVDQIELNGISSLALRSHCTRC